MIDGGHLVAKMLQREKIDVVFTLCGGHIMPIYNGLMKASASLTCGMNTPPRTRVAPTTERI